MVRTWEWDVRPEDRSVLAPEGDVEDIVDLLKNADRIVGHNIKFDVAALASVFPWFDTDWPWEKTDDTLLHAHLLHSNQPKNLTALALRWLGANIEPAEDGLEAAVKECRRAVQQDKLRRKRARERAVDEPEIYEQADPGTEWPRADWKIADDSILTDNPSAGTGESWRADYWLPKAFDPASTVLRDYADIDSQATMALYPVLEAEIDRRKLRKHLEQRRKLLRVVYEMERDGVTIDGRRTTDVINLYRRENAETAEKLVAVAAGYGHDLVIPKGASPNASLRTFCFDHLKLPQHRGKKAKTDAPTLNKEVMELYRGTLDKKSKAFYFIDNLLLKRKRDTAISYAEGYRKFWKLLGVGNDERTVSSPQEHRHGGGDSRRFVGGDCGSANNDWFVLHPSLNIVGTDTLRGSSSHPNGQNICFDGETEILTSKGWVRADAVEDGQTVAQYHPVDGGVDFHPAKVHQVHHTGDMIHITTAQQIDMLLTPNHRCLLADRQTGKKFDVKAKDFQTDRLHFGAGVFVGGGTELTEHQVTWVCAVQADGSYQRTDGEEYGIRFVFKKERKIERLRTCLVALGAGYTEKELEDGKVSFYIGKNESIVGFVKSLLPEKKFGPWMMDLDRPTLDAFRNEVFFWDGDHTKEGSYSSSEKTNSDWVQILFILSGCRAWVKTYTPSSGWSKKDHHRVNVTKDKDNSMTTNFHKRVVPWDGLVYCVTVPSSYVIIRRNGKVSVTGNSKQDAACRRCGGEPDDAPACPRCKGMGKDLRSMRYCFGPAPGREWWSLDYKNLELRLPFYRAGEKELISLFEEPDRPPFYGSNHILNFSVVYPDLWDDVLRKHGPEKAAGWIKSKEGYGSTWYHSCKCGNFAIQYNAGRATADATYKRPGSYDLLKSRFGLLERFNQECIARANKYGYVETFPDRTVDPERGYPIVCSRSERGDVSPTIPLSYVIQSTAMWCTMVSMVRVHGLFADWHRRSRGKFDARITLQVHDELVIDLPKRADPRTDPNGSNLSRVLEVARTMERVGGDLLPVPVPVPVGVTYHSESWAEGEDFK